MSLETDLKNAFRRVPAPEGFASRVLERAVGARSGAPGTSGSCGRAAARPYARGWRAIAATFLLAAILGGWGAHEMIERRQEREGQRARQQVLLALRIAGTKVAHAQREVREIGSRHISR